MTPMAELLALIAPPGCLACRRALPRAGDRLCADCSRALPWLRAGCGRCGLPAHRGKRCPAAGAAFGRAWAPLAYQGVARKLVAALKFRGALAAADLMAAHMAANLPADLREGRHRHPRAGAGDARAAPGARVRPGARAHDRAGAPARPSPRGLPRARRPREPPGRSESPGAACSGPPGDPRARLAAADRDPGRRCPHDRRDPLRVCARVDRRGHDGARGGQLRPHVVSGAAWRGVARAWRSAAWRGVARSRR